jgi:hypothetical protein
MIRLAVLTATARTLPLARVRFHPANNIAISAGGQNRPQADSIQVHVEFPPRSKLSFGSDNPRGCDILPRGLESPRRSGAKRAQRRLRCSPTSLFADFAFRQYSGHLPCLPSAANKSDVGA